MKLVDAFTVHEVVAPVSAVGGVVWPCHLTIASALVILEIALILGAVCVLENALATFFVVNILTVILVDRAVGFADPHTEAVAETVLKLALVAVSIVPNVIALSIRLAIRVIAVELVSVLEVLFAVAVLEVVDRGTEVARGEGERYMSLEI